MHNDQDATLRDMVHRAAKWFPKNEAIVDDICRYTYADLLDKIQRTAKLLHTRGVRKGDRVALLLYPSANHVVALFGAIELGAIPVALHLRESPATIAATLERLSPRALIYDGQLADVADHLRDAVPVITSYIRAVSERTPQEAIDNSPDVVIPRDLGDYELDFRPMPLKDTDTAVIALSSGTTGLPKGIMHTHRTLVESARGGAYVWATSPHSCIVNMSTTAFIGWYNCTLPFINSASKIVMMSGWDPEVWLQKNQDEGGTVAFLVPTMWRMLMRRDDIDKYDFSKVERAGFAGEPMDTSTMALVQEKITPSIINIYGTTETGSCAAGTVMFTPDFDDPTKMASVGKPFINSDVRVIEPGGKCTDVLPTGEEGEVIIRGLSVASQVWDQPEVAERIFEGPWWHSGDMGVIDEDNYVYLRGRIDDMIISGGINILPSRVEDLVLSHPAISECAVVGVSDEQWGQKVVAYVVTTSEVTEQELLDYAKTTDLASYQRPKEYRFMDELPKGNTGKVSRRGLRTMAES